MNDTMDKELSARLDAEIRAFQIDIPRAELTSTGYDPLGWAARTLRHQEMPIEEIRAILWADDPELVHTYMELHRERLEERLVAQQRTLVLLERRLAERIRTSTVGEPNVVPALTIRPLDPETEG